MTGIGELLAVTLVLGVMLSGLLIMMRGRQPLRTFRGTTRIREPRRPGLPLTCLGLLAAGDGFLLLEPLGAPAVAAVALGVGAGFLGSERVFPVLGALAALAGLASLFAGTLAQSVLAVFVLVPLALGILLGVFPFGDVRPTSLVAKVCAAIVLARFATSPLDAAVVEPGVALDVFRAVVTVAAAWFAMPLFLLRGPGVSLLLGIGIGLLELYVSARGGEPLSWFTIAFVAAWFLTSLLCTRVRGRR